jgi:putative ATPase
MSDTLFEYGAAEAVAAGRPLAERMRPKTLEEITGQQHVLGPQGVIRRALESDRIFSMIFWGPPGCGKTTLARLIAGQTRSHFVHFSAVLSGVKEIRSVIAEAEEQRRLRHRRTVLFVDEIHRFNKSQQDAFLHHVESGLLTLIGATTENPSFEVIPPLLSRCRVITLNPLAKEALSRIVRRALSDPDRGLGRQALSIDADALDFLVASADGDARAALNGLEIAASLMSGEAAESSPQRLTLKTIRRALQKRTLRYDKDGEEHYNLISAFHKSLRGSDPDAALYWLERMLVGGEEPLYVARRMVRFASEDVGNADPGALSIALSAAEAFRMLGSPEGELALAQAAVYLAAAPKSNRVYAAVRAAREEIERSGSLPVPLHIRNAPTRLMKNLGYGKGYRYAHDFSDGYIPQRYLPDAVQQAIFYSPTNRGFEKTIRERIRYWQRLLREAEENSSRSGPDEGGGK